MRTNGSCTHFGASAPRQSLPLFDQNSATEAVPGSLNDDALVRGIITASIKRSKLSRESVAERMQEMLGIAVTARMITSFTAHSKELHRWPGAWTRAFCVAVGDDSLLRCCAEAAGYRLIRNEEIELLELGREFLRQRRASEQVALLEARLRGADL